MIWRFSPHGEITISASLGTSCCPGVAPPRRLTWEDGRCGIGHHLGTRVQSTDPYSAAVDDRARLEGGRRSGIASAVRRRAVHRAWLEAGSGDGRSRCSRRARAIRVAGQHRCSGPARRSPSRAAGGRKRCTRRSRGRWRRDCRRSLRQARFRTALRLRVLVERTKSTTHKCWFAR